MRFSIAQGFLVAMVVASVLPACGDPIASSHINAHVPDASEFDALLGRDLRAHFGGVRGESINVGYELLRKAPTQSGIAFPKYYAWIELLDLNGEVVDVGAVRLAAIDRARFEVTHFISRDEIRSGSADLKSIFPEVLCETIEARAAMR